MSAFSRFENPDGVHELGFDEALRCAENLRDHIDPDSNVSWYPYCRTSVEEHVNDLLNWHIPASRQLNFDDRTLLSVKRHKPNR